MSGYASRPGRVFLPLFSMLSVHHCALFRQPPVSLSLARSLPRFQVLEPALAAMEQQRQEEDEDEDEEEEEGEEEAPEGDEPDGRENAVDSDAEPPSPAGATTDTNSDTDAGAGKGLPVTPPPKSAEAAPGNGSRGDRSRERLAWRCVEAARAASSLVPPLTAHALLPAAGLRLPHSCAPAVRVPAGDRRTYNAPGGGGGGAAGRPLTVAMVALRNIPAGAPLSCSWVDAQEPFAARMSRLKEYNQVTVVPRTVSTVAGPGGSGGARESEGAAVGGCGGGCGCPKCFVEGHDAVGGCGGDGDGSGLGVERLLEAARLAVDEDR